MSDAPAGLLDTNIVIHAQANDRASEECRAFLAALEHGRLHAHLELAVLHEISFTLPRYVKQMTREQVAGYLLTVLGWPGVEGDKETMTSTVERWRDAPGLGFVDAYLATLALQRGTLVYTKNIQDFLNQGVTVPRPLPLAD